MSRDELFESLLGDFLDESGQLLEKLSNDLLRLDDWVQSVGGGPAPGCDPELMNEMFRSAHSLKGLSAMLGLMDINRLTHKVENVFDAARNDELAFSSDSVALALRAVDRLAVMVEALNDPQAVGVDCEDVAAEIQQLLAESGVERQASSQADAESAMEVEMETPAATDSALDAPLPSRPEVDYFAGVSDEAGAPDKYLAIFIDETTLALDSLTETLLALEGRGDAKAVESLLVTSHRIKGSAACVGLNRPAKLAHMMEDVLQELRESRKELAPCAADAMLKCTDALRRYVDGLKSGRPDAEQFSSAANELVQSTIAAANPEPASEASPTQSSAPADAEATASTSAPTAATECPGRKLDEALRSAVLAANTGAVASLYGIIRFKKGLPLAGLKARLVYEKLSQVGQVYYCDPAADGLDELDELSDLAFGVATDAAPEALIAFVQVEGIDNVDATSLLSEAAPTPTSAAASPPASSAPSPQAPKPIPLPPQSRPAVAEATPPEQEAQRNGDPASRPAETLRVDIDRLDQLMNLAGQLVINKARLHRIDGTLRQVSINKHVSKTVNDVETMLDKILSIDMQETSTARIDQNLDALRSQARRLQSDMKCVRNMIEQFGSVRTSINDLSDAVHQLERVTDGIQKSVMDTRMVPIGPLFSRFRRVIRDITRGNGKDIRLVIRGEKTELDKRMIDELGDPLIHMVRNSADHGIESPEVREAAGKPRQGTITLDAFHRGNSIVIQVSDDGKGLDQDRIRAKAVEKGIVSQADADRMTPHQVYQLIWEPGFSTAEKVTEISGRGMGMDIVKSKLEEINGAVDLDSTPGKGTTLTIKLPLTLAILPSLMAEIDGDVFALPIEAVSEIVSVQRTELTYAHGRQCAVVRGRVVSVVQLTDLFQWNSPPSRDVQRNDDDITLVILGSEGRELGLAVDRLLGEEDVVIKSMAENFRNVYGIAGASILGDGAVSLILDTSVLIDMASRQPAAADEPQECLT